MLALARLISTGITVSTVRGKERGFSSSWDAVVLDIDEYGERLQRKESPDREDDGSGWTKQEVILVVNMHVSRKAITQEGTISWSRFLILGSCPVFFSIFSYCAVSLFSVLRVTNTSFTR